MQTKDQAEFQNSQTSQHPGGAGLDKWALDELSTIGKVIAVISGKGGVGKSSVSALTACCLARSGYKVGILDADITGPSIPKMFGLRDKLIPYRQGFIPAASKVLGIEVVSINLLLDDEESPVVWRGPLLAGMVKRFWSDTAWGGLDYLVIDLPPGTGDVPLSVMQSVPVDGFLLVSSPQELAVMVVKKALKMVRMLDKEIIGLVENMSYLICPHCGDRLHPFGEPQGGCIAADLGFKFLGELPIDRRLAELCDQGSIEEYTGDALSPISAGILAFAGASGSR